MAGVDLPSTSVADDGSSGLLQVGIVYPWELGYDPHLAILEATVKGVLEALPPGNPRRGDGPFRTDSTIGPLRADRAWTTLRNLPTKKFDTKPSSLTLKAAIATLSQARAHTRLLVVIDDFQEPFDGGSGSLAVRAEIEKNREANISVAIVSLGVKTSDGRMANLYLTPALQGAHRKPSRVHNLRQTHLRRSRSASPSSTCDFGCLGGPRSVPGRPKRWCRSRRTGEATRQEISLGWLGSSQSRIAAVGGHRRRTSPPFSLC